MPHNTQLEICTMQESFISQQATSLSSNDTHLHGMNMCGSA